jgi:hypothetical protein
MRCRPGVWIVALSAAAGCQSLPDIGADVCGNLVLEAGEDCDGFGDGDNTACGNPGTANGCFFVCDPDNLESEPCPEGFGCGADGRCRAPSESFTEGAQVSFPVADFKVADIDGDGTEDLIGSSQNAFHIAFGDGDGRLSARTFPYQLWASRGGRLGARQVDDRVEAFDLPIEDIVDEARDVVGRLRTCRCRRGNRHQVGVAVERVAPGPAVALDARAVADPVVGHLGDHIVGAGLAESSDL